MEAVNLISSNKYSEKQIVRTPCSANLLDLFHTLNWIALNGIVGLPRHYPPAARKLGPDPAGDQLDP